MNINKNISLSVIGKVETLQAIVSTIHLPNLIPLFELLNIFIIPVEIKYDNTKNIIFDI